MIINNESSVSSEQFVTQKKSKKKLEIKGNKNATKKNQKKTKLTIVNDDSSSDI